jgi:hypothetical protein
VTTTAWDGPATSTKCPAGNRLTRVANKEAPALSARRPGGSATHGKCEAAARAGPCNSIEPNDKAGVEQAVNRRYPKWANGRIRDPQAEAWCQAKRDDKEAQEGGTRSPQGPMALFGLTASSGVPADKKIKGKTGQGISAANFFRNLTLTLINCCLRCSALQHCSNQPRRTIFREEPASAEALPIFSWPQNASSKKRPH